jgi:hypothetical protein
MDEPNANQGQLPAQPLDGTVKPEEVVEIEGKKYVPVEKFTASAQEAVRLLHENEELKKPKSPELQQIPAEEQRVREVLTKLQQEQAQKEKADALQLRKELDELKIVYGDFDEQKLQKIVTRYGVYNDNESVNWDAAMELYKKIGDVPDKAPKEVLAQQRAIPNPQEIQVKVETANKSLHELAQEGLKRFGIIK